MYIHPRLPEILVPDAVTLMLEGKDRDIAVTRSDRDVYYNLSQDEFNAGCGYAAFPLEIGSQEAVDQLGPHTLELFAIHPGSHMELLRIVDEAATMVDRSYTGNGTALAYDVALRRLRRFNVGGHLPALHNTVTRNKLINYYANTMQGLGFISLTTPEFYSGIEVPASRHDPEIEPVVWMADAALRQTCELIR